MGRGSRPASVSCALRLLSCLVLALQADASRAQQELAKESGQVGRFAARFGDARMVAARAPVMKNPDGERGVLGSY